MIVFMYFASNKAGRCIQHRGIAVGCAVSHITKAGTQSRDASCRWCDCNMFNKGGLQNTVCLLAGYIGGHKQRVLQWRIYGDRKGFWSKSGIRQSFREGILNPSAG